MAKKHGKRNPSFIQELIRHCLELRKIKSKEICIFNVVAKHGWYQIKIGPEHGPKECKRLHTKPHSRTIEINGSMHHLFVSPRKVSPLPGHEEIRANLRGSVIMKDISVHIVDRDGQGAKVTIEELTKKENVRPELSINLAGEEGETMIERFHSSGRLAHEAYKIIQEDILKTLKVHH